MTRRRPLREGLPGARGDLIRIGFVPLCDCAPVVMAHELGLFAARGLRVELSREIGWATVRDKIVLRELEAAHAPAAMVIAISLGIGSFKVPCTTGLVLNLHGNAITLSNRVYRAGARDVSALVEFVRSRRTEAPIALGVAFSCSSHNFLLQKWLRDAQLDPCRDVRIAVVPPSQMVANLRAGNLDGYCVGEPWNSLAVFQRAGWVADLSSRISPRHPEKVFLVRSDFAERRPDQHESLISALLEACEFCQLAENQDRLVQTLSSRRYLNVNREVIQRSLGGPFKFSRQKAQFEPELHVFAGPWVNEPAPQKASWALRSLVETGVLTRAGQVGPERLRSMFRMDLFESACSAAKPRHPHRQH